MADYYNIVRYFANDKYPTKVLKRNVSLAEAQAHCNDPETSSKTCTKTHGKRTTERYGEWFDGFVKV